jgi:hypothetical protein
MSTYPQRIRDNILPLSIGATLPEAFEEWSFTEETVDHGHATETCELCEQEELRYHFRIQNQLTAHRLWVGSQCILRFDVSVFEQGMRLSAADAKKKLSRLMQQMHLESCIKALERLTVSESNPILSNALTYFRTNKSLTPKFAFVVLWRLQAHRIDHNPGFFKVSLQKDRHKADLATMDTSKVHLIWPALSSAQRAVAMRLGHVAPAPRP